MWSEHDVQSIFEGQGSKYFPVHTAHLVENPDLDALLQQALMQASIDDEEETRRNNTIIPDGANERTDPWMNRGRWLDTLAGQNMRELYPLTSARSEDDEGFKFLQKSIPSLIKRCLEGVRDLDKRGWDILRFWLNSSEINKADTKPFQVHYNDGTLARYSEYWLRFILFMLRTFDIEDTGNNGVKYTTHQHEAIGELRALVSMEIPSEEDVHQKILEISKTFIDHEDFSTNWPSPLKYFCSVMAWDYSTERWRRPGTYTPFLAGIQFCMRVLSCEILLPSDERDGYCQRGAGASSPLDDLEKGRKQWLVHGQPYPYRWVHSLLNYGMIPGLQERSVDKIRFDGDKYLYWQGEELDIEAWRRFPRDILRTAEKILSRDLLFRETDLIDVINPYSIKENETCHDNQYFFGCGISGYKRQARETIVKNIGNRAQDWGTNINGILKWTPAFVNEYIWAQNKFLEHVLIGLNTLGGLTGRGPEILSLLYKNTPQSDRNIRLEAGQIVITTTYHKSQNIMDAIKVYMLTY
jgi:hypothetical protein